MRLQNYIRRKLWSEGDTDGNKSSKEQVGGGNGPSSGKVERRESTRLASGASKFLRSLRSGHHNLAGTKEPANGTIEPVNVIALKEFDSENLSLDVRDQSGQDFSTATGPLAASAARLPERSQSFQEKRNLELARPIALSPAAIGTGTSTTTPVTATTNQNQKHHTTHSNSNSSNARVKHSRTQSFICSSSTSALNNISSRPVVSLCPDPRKVSNAGQNSEAVTGRDRETIYENLEVIREHKLSKNNKNNISISNKQGSEIYPDKNKTDVRQKLTIPAMTVADKEQQRRPGRKLVKESGYETNFSHYVNIDEARRGSSISTSVNGRNCVQQSESPSNNKVITSSRNGSVQENRGLSLYGSPAQFPATNSVNNKQLQAANTPSQENRKLRRSISEVPPERMSLSKLQSKAMDTSRTIYSSISNGLSIWNVEKNAGRTETVNKSAAYSIYNQGVHSKSLPIVSNSATLPRSTSNYQTVSTKSTRSLRHDFEVSSAAESTLSPLSLATDKVPTSALSPARSAPNLQQQQQFHIAHQRSLNNLNKIYQTPAPIPTSSPYQKYAQNFQHHPRQLSAPLVPASASALAETKLCTSTVKFSNLQLLNDKKYEEIVKISYTSGQTQHQQQHQGAMSNANGASSWTSNEQMLTAAASPCSPLSSAPARDASSLKQIRYGPGHEKYPSWPIPVSSAAQIDPAGELNNIPLSSSGSSRSKSWTDQTDYPKEKAPTYARPYMKRMNHAYTQQLKTVMEKCERIPPETFCSATKGVGAGENGFAGILPPPMGYRDHSLSSGYSGHHQKSSSEGQLLGSGSGTKEYNIPSPPERDVLEPSKPFTQDDLEQYEKKYEEMMSQYSHSEGYHSYISSECSSYVGSGTPFLDQLCRESESNQEFWPGEMCDPNDPLFGMNHLGTSGRESVTTVVTNSSSNSSGNETLKWHGSTGDLSISASVSSTNNSRAWEHQHQANIAHSAKVPLPRKVFPDAVLLHNNGSRHIKDKLESPTKNHGSSAPNLKKFPLSTYTRPSTLSLSGSGASPPRKELHQKQRPTEQISGGRGSSKTNLALNKSPAKQPIQISNSAIIDTSKPPSVAERIQELEQQSLSLSSGENWNAKNTNSGLSNPPSTSQSSIAAAASTVPVSLSNVHSSIIHNLKSSSLNSLRESKRAQPQHPQPFKKTNSTSSSSSGETPTKKSSSSNEGYQNFWNSFSTESSSNSASNSSGSPPVSYTYLDTEKKHRVADMTLKAIQKKALLAYYERHTGKQALNESHGYHNHAPPSPKKDTDSSHLNSFEKDLPFPPIALTLSLPRDIDRLKNSLSAPHVLRLQSEEFPRNDGPGHTYSDANCLSSNRASSQSAKTLPLNQGIQVSSSSSSSELKNAKGDKGEFGRSGHPQSQHEELNGESARMAYMSKYLPHLASRETNGSMPTWSGVTMSSSSGLTTTPSSSVEGILASLSETPAPIPPERPPKKPHLRNVAQQNVNDGLQSMMPPPPLPRAPVRPPQSSSSSSSSSSSGGGVCIGVPPPLPSKPLPRCPSPELPPPPPPLPTTEADESEVFNDDPLPPPPSAMEVNNLIGSRSRSVSGLSSYLHKESYLAQRKERSLGYEGRYRRTLSPSGLGAKSPASDTASQQQSMSNSTSTGKLDSTLSPSAWEKYHNIRAPNTTVIFTSENIPHSLTSQQQHDLAQQQSPLFHRSISCDSNLFNNKTGFSQPPLSTFPPPVAQVAPLPLRGQNQQSESFNHYRAQMSSTKSTFLENSSSTGFVPAFHSPPAHQSNDLKSKTGNGASPINNDQENEENDLILKKVGKRGVNVSDSQCQNSASEMPIAKSLMVMVSPLRFEVSTMTMMTTTKSMSPLAESVQISKSPVHTNNKSEVSFRVNCTSDASSQTDSGNEEESEIDLTMAAGQLPLQLAESMSQGSGSLSSASSTVSSSSSSASSSSGSPTMQMQSSNELMTVMSIGKGCNGIENGSGGSVSPTTSSSSYVGRQKSQEELDCEELSKDLAKQLPQGDKLQTLLVPLPEHKTSADYMEGLFHLEMELTNDQLESHSKCRRSSSSSPELPKETPQIGHETYNHYQQPQKVTSHHQSQSVMESKEKFSTLAKDSDSVQKRCNGHAPLPADSAYFTTSECKAKFLTQYVKDMHNKSICSTDGEELVKQKEELVLRISRKLEILRIEQSEIQEEIQSNELLGHTVVERVKQTAKRNEFDKFKLHVEAIEKITSLLLGLSGRLARAENALMGLVTSSNPQEKKTLESKRDKLKEQLDEAKILKENIDRRSAQVSEFLQKYLTVEEYADYHHFTKMKAKLIIDAREIDEKIKLGEEQMIALQDTLS